MAKRITQLELMELSLVDNPANQHARVVLHKRLGMPEELLKSDDRRARSFAEIMTEREEWRRQHEAQEEFWPIHDAMMTSLNSIMADAALDSPQKMSRINETIDQFLATLREKIPEVEEEISKALEAAVARGDDPEAPRGDKDMDEVTKKVSDLEKSVADLTTKNASLETELAKAQSRAIELEKAAEAARTDEVLKIGEVEVRKSVVGEGTFAAMKAQQAANEELHKRLELADLEKRAEADWAHLPGTPADKARVAKAISGMPEAVAKTAREMLSAGNTALTMATRPVGLAGDVRKGSAEDQLSEMAKKRLAEDPKLGTFAKAYNAVLETPEGKKLYEQTIN